MGKGGGGGGGGGGNGGVMVVAVVAVMMNVGDGCDSCGGGSSGRRLGRSGVLTSWESEREVKGLGGGGADGRRPDFCVKTYRGRSGRFLRCLELGMGRCG